MELCIGDVRLMLHWQREYYFDWEKKTGDNDSVTECKRDVPVAKMFEGNFITVSSYMTHAKRPRTGN